MWAAYCPLCPLNLDQWEVEQDQAKGKVRLKTGSITASMKGVHELRAEK